MPESLFVFNWSEVAGEPLCKQLQQAAGIGDRRVEQLRPLVGRILSLVGGLPVSPVRLSVQELTALGERLLLEACRHTLFTYYLHWESRGYMLHGNRVVDVDRICVNTGSAHSLASLPGIGIALAERVVEERLSHGVFTSADDLDRRVKGVGEKLVSALRNAFSFATPADEGHTLPYGATGLPDCLSALMAYSRHPDPSARFVQALENVAITCASTPHPAVRDKRARHFLDRSGDLHDVDELAVLTGSTYYDVMLNQLRAAKTLVSVCMFHIAMPGEIHPTKKLLDALVDAHHRGVDVRVLVDRDEKKDPYRSEIINRAALEFLVSHGVASRSDSSDRLLHSKFVVIDGAVVIIGSHNWSAGSYFQFDDASVRVSSPEFAAVMSRRFDELWEKASA